MPYQVEGPCGYLVSGDLATWVGSIGTLLAFAVALALLSINLRDRERAQARLVSGYLVKGRIQHLAGTSLNLGQPQKEFYIEPDVLLSPADKDMNVVLASDVLLFKWTLRNDSDEMLGRVRISLVTDQGKVIQELNSRPFLAPHTTQERSDVLADRADLREPLNVRVEFEDAVGRRWERESGSTLRRLRKDRHTALDEVSPSHAGVWVQLEGGPTGLRQFRS